MANGGKCPSKSASFKKVRVVTPSTGCTEDRWLFSDGSGAETIRFYAKVEADVQEILLASGDRGVPAHASTLLQQIAGTYAKENGLSHLVQGNLPSLSETHFESTPSLRDAAMVQSIVEATRGS